MRLKWPLLGLVLFGIIIFVCIWLYVRRKKYFKYNPFATLSGILSFENILLLITLGVFIGTSIILASRPQKISKFVEEQNLSDIYILLDVSGSMDILLDNGKSRLEVAKQSLLKLLDNLPKNRFRVGFIIFIDYPLLQIPLTRDYDIIKERVKLSNSMDLPLLPDMKTGATDIAQAIAFAVIKLAQLQPPDYKISKVPKDKRGAIVLITDGVQTTMSEYTLEEASTLAAKYNIRVYPIVVNSSKAHFAFEQAQQIAETSKGKAFLVDNTNKFLDVIDEIAKLEKKRIKAPEKKIYRDVPEVFMFVWFLALIILVGFKIKTYRL